MYNQHCGLFIMLVALIVFLWLFQGAASLIVIVSKIEDSLGKVAESITAISCQIRIQQLLSIKTFTLPH